MSQSFDFTSYNNISDLLNKKKDVDIIVIDKDTYEFVYFVGFNKNFKDKSLSLTLSNKKGNDNPMKTVKDLIKLSKTLNKLYSKNKKVMNDLKYNRINMDRKDVK